MVRAPACQVGSCGFKSRLSRLFETFLFILVFLPIFLLSSCASDSIEDFRNHGDAISRSLVEEFRKVHNRDELLASVPKLKKLFNELTQTIIDACEFRDKHCGLEEDSSKESHISEQLRQEMIRVYHIEGGKEIIENCQKEALYQLDVYDQQRRNKKGRL